MEKINKLMKQLSRKFRMKDLGTTKKILRMRISIDRHKVTLQLSNEEYIRRVLKSYSMSYAKPITLFLTIQFKLTNRQCQMATKELHG